LCKLIRKKTISKTETTIDLKVDGVVSNDLKVGGDLKYNFDSNQCEARVYQELKLDKSTAFKARIDDLKTISLGVTHNYRDLINFGFVSRLKLVEHFTKIGDAPVKQHNIKTSITCKILNI